MILYDFDNDVDESGGDDEQINDDNSDPDGVNGDGDGNGRKQNDDVVGDDNWELASAGMIVVFTQHHSAQFRILF